MQNKIKLEERKTTKDEALLDIIRDEVKKQDNKEEKNQKQEN